MTGDPFTERLSAYLDDELPPAERLSVERHLAGCPACRADLAGLSALVETLRALPAIPAPPGMDVRAQAVIARRSAASPLQAIIESLRRHSRAYALAVSGLAAAAVALAILPFEQGTQPGPTPAAPSRPATPPSKAVSRPTGAPAATPAQPAPDVTNPPMGMVAPQDTTGPLPAIASRPASPPQSEAAQSEALLFGRAQTSRFMGGGAMRGGAMSERAGGVRFNGASTTDGQWTEIAATNADSIVTIDAEWRLYDGASETPIFQKVLRNRQGEPALAFVRLKNGKSVRWLTLDDDGGRNAPIQGHGLGEGFLADDQGDVLTTKSVVAGWAVRFDDPLGAAVIVDEGSAVPEYPSDVALDAATLDDAEAWIPKSGGYVFAAGAPVPITSRPRPFIGRNVKLSVLVGGTDEGAKSRIAGLSGDADVARLRLDPPPKVRAMAVAQGEALPIDKQILVLGGFRLSSWLTARRADALGAQVKAATAATTTGQVSPTDFEAPPRRMADEPVPSKTQAHPGQIADQSIHKLLGRVGLPVFGDANGPARYGIVLRGGGDEPGSPVLDQDGKVVGLLTEAKRPGNPRPDYVITPIRPGLALLPSDRPHP